MYSRACINEIVPSFPEFQGRSLRILLFGANLKKPALLCVVDWYEVLVQGYRATLSILSRKSGIFEKLALFEVYLKVSVRNY